jgi:hypothetical protein
MALKHIFIAFFSMTLLADISLAQVRTFPHGPGRPGSDRDHRGGHWPGHGGGSGPNYPPAPPPPAPNYPPNPGYQEQRTAYVNRRMINERLSLLQLLQIGQQYRGYTVDSVIVNTRGSNGRMDLLVNGAVQSSLSNGFGAIRLVPSYNTTVGVNLNTLELGVAGFADVDSITVNLTRGNSGPVPGPNDIVLPISINQRIYSNGRLDVSALIDMNRYRGMRIIAIDINANSVYQQATLSTLVNGQNVGALALSPYSAVQSLYPQYAILGQYADALVFVATGDLNLNSVTLRLSR